MQRYEREDDVDKMKEKQGKMLNKMVKNYFKCKKNLKEINLTKSS